MLDFPATWAELAGTEAPEGEDSISYLPTLLGEWQTQQHDDVVVRHRNNAIGSRAQIMRDGFKLVEADRIKGLFQLYHVADDDEERLDLALQSPEKLE